MPVHHAPDELLFDYARGALGVPASLVVETHLALDPESRSHVKDYDCIGGLLLEEIEPAEVSTNCLAEVMERLDQTPELPEAVEVHEDARGETQDSLLPRPLRRYVGGGLDSLSWRRVMSGLEEARLEAGEDTSKQWRLRLMRIAPGTSVPQHTHKGVEYTLVLQGAYNDESGRFARGDLQVADAEVDHRPVAEGGEPCLCLVLSDAPLRFTGTFGRFLNPFIRY